MRQKQKPQSNQRNQTQGLPRYLNPTGCDLILLLQPILLSSSPGIMVLREGFQGSLFLMLSEIGAELVPGCSVIGTNCKHAEHRDHLYSHLHMQKQVAAQIFPYNYNPLQAYVALYITV